MKLDDFRYIYQGKLTPLSTDHAKLLQPIDIRKPHHSKALLLLHGFSSSPAVFRELLPTLSSIYDAVVCPALPGHAESFTAFSKVQANHWFERANQSCKELIDTYEHVDVMGLSLGGVLACYLAYQYPIHHLYLLAPALALRINTPVALKLAKFLNRLGLKKLKNRGGHIHTKRTGELTYHHIPLTAIIEILTLVKEFKFTIPSCPIDLFLGCHDEVVNSKAVEKLFHPSKNTQIHWLKNSAHILPLDGDIDTITAILLSQQKK